MTRYSSHVLIVLSSKVTLIFLLLLTTASFVFSQATQDTLQIKKLSPVIVEDKQQQHLSSVENLFIYAGKKTNIVTPDPGNANLAQNIGRMAFAQVPGINVWDMDGAGTQINIGTRATDMHRSIEMNMRQNGYNTNSDMFGYPEDHYTPPMQGIGKIEVVRGSAALQFGSQFGGMVNYKMKQGDSTKQFSLESEQTAGAYNFFNSYNAIGGTVNKINYYAYYDNRHGDGWRPNAAFNYHAYYSNINWKVNRKLNLSFQFSRMDYVQQIAGGLTDSQFQINPRQSNRARNYFNPIINIPAITLDYFLSKRTKMQITSHVLFGARNSVQFINTPLVADTFNTSMNSLNPRQVDRDYYNGFTTEARLLHHYTLGNISSSLAGGIRYFTEMTNRMQKGVGTTGSDFDLSLVNPYGIRLNLHTQNYALFAENLVQLSPRLLVIPGFRYEVIHSSMTGVINHATVPVSYQATRNFPLFGLGFQYEATRSSEFYGNISQAYRPFLYANITPATQLGVINPNLKDSKGYNIDIGYRGSYSNVVRFDINAYYLYYGDRIGQLNMVNPSTNTTYLLTTNIGNAVSQGIEAYLSVSLVSLIASHVSTFDMRIFNSMTYNHARYVTGEMNYSGVNKTLTGNHLEGVPDWINRTGLELRFKKVTSTLQSSYVSKNFSDANNTVFDATGATGVVPSYQVWDWAFSYQFLQSYKISCGVNNLTNLLYFTRRINMYPGPGILPADGRTFYFSLGLKI